MTHPTERLKALESKLAKALIERESALLWQNHYRQRLNDAAGVIAALRECRKPRVVATLEELDTLPFLAVIRDAEGDIHERLEWNYGPSLQWVSDGAEDRQPKLPATVLFTPEEKS